MLWAFFISHFMLKSLLCVSKTHRSSLGLCAGEKGICGGSEQQDYNLILLFTLSDEPNSLNKTIQYYESY